MITEAFINSCFSLVLSEEEKIRSNKPLHRDILDIIESYRKKESMDIPLLVKTKVECLEKICEMKIEGRTPLTIVDNILVGEKFKKIKEFIEEKTGEKLSLSDLNDYVKEVTVRKKLAGIFSHADKSAKFFEMYKTSTFKSTDDFILDYENLVKVQYVDLMNVNRLSLIEASASLDTGTDDIEPILQNIVKKYERSSVTPTGIDVLDRRILNGGFEKSRLYVFAGGTGSGKSTLLNNFIVQSATCDWTQFYLKSDPRLQTKKVFIYITLENTIDESLLRKYDALFYKNSTEHINEMKNSSFEAKTKFIKKMEDNNSILVMKYFIPQTISVTDIMMVVDETIQKYGKDSIKGIYIDYLDLLKNDIKYDLYRLELGHITLSLKTLAVQYDVPVITVTQATRDVYKSQDQRGPLGLGLLSESIQKAHHADFVCILAKDEVDEKIIHARVGKNRVGRSNIQLIFDVDFRYYRFIRGKIAESSTDNKQNRLTDTISGDVNYEIDSTKGQIKII
jgi:replicative DNA helicase